MGSDAPKLKLVQVRDCDGRCCKESPRWPNAGRTDCIYHTGGDLARGCTLWNNPKFIPVDSPVLPHMTGEEAFKETCKGWPQNSIPRKGQTDGCCWQWLDGD